MARKPVVAASRSISEKKFSGSITYDRCSRMRAELKQAREHFRLFVVVTTDENTTYSPITISGCAIRHAATREYGIATELRPT
jgi:hypothetical protein